MASISATPRQASSAYRELAIVILVLLGVLGALFRQSFQADQVLFANDGPLGVLVAFGDVASTLLTGNWNCYNWVGIKLPSALPSVSFGSYFLWGPVAHMKFLVPLALLLLGLGTWALLRQLRFKPVVCILGALAMVLNTDPFSYACWGLPSLPLTVASVMFAFAALASDSGVRGWLKAALAGLAVGMAIMEGFDNGAILSLYVAAFVLFQALCERGTLGARVGKGVGRVAIVAIFAAFMSAHALSTLIGTQIKGVVGMQQDTKTKQERWDEATMWSLPKLETLRVIIPGVFGYRMDTPDGGNYWGSVGQSPGDPKSRHSGSGLYGGVLVVLVAIWAFVATFRRGGNAFSDRERKAVWFWAGAALASLLLAFGRHAPFYQFFYQLPYFSTIRSPIKFLHPFHIALVVLFGYGLEALYRQYLDRNLIKSDSLAEQLKAWWRAVPIFEKKWAHGTVGALGAGIFAWLIFASSRAELKAYLETIGFPAELSAPMARFSSTEVGWFVLFLGLAVSAVIVIVSGALSGPRAKWAGLVLGLILVSDFSRANSPWIIFYNYRERYASNPVIDVLRDKPHEHRVAARLLPRGGGYLANAEGWAQAYQVWLEHLFQFYQIHSLDVIQMPRPPVLDDAMFAAFRPTPLDNPTNFWHVGRLWQLTNTRYVLGMRGFLDFINQQIDPRQKSFRVHTAFGPDGQLALFEFGAALPRAKLYPRWQVVTNDDQSALQRLTDPAFDPSAEVLVADPIPAPDAMGANTNQPPGAVSITQYAPRHVALQSDAGTPTVLLLNDRYDPDWKVTVDGQPQPLLRCNFIMRGVQLPAGRHVIEFRYEPPASMLYVSLAAIAVGLALCAFLMIRNEGTGDLRGT